CPWPRFLLSLSHLVIRTVEDGPKLDFGHFPALIGCAGRGTPDRYRRCRGRPQAGVSDAPDYRRFASARERLTSRTARSDRCSEWDAAARWAPGDEAHK